MSYSKYIKIRNLLRDIQVNDLIDFLNENSCSYFKIEYSGSGDSGQIDSISLVNANNSESSIDIDIDHEGVVTYYGNNYINSVKGVLSAEVKTYILCTEFEKEKFGTVLKEENVKLYDLLSNFGYYLLDKYQRGFEDGSGSFGIFFVKIVENKFHIENEHNYYVIDTRNDNNVIDRKNKVTLIEKLLEEENEVGSSN